jgi:hypothetical protein
MATNDQAALVATPINTPPATPIHLFLEKQEKDALEEGRRVWAALPGKLARERAQCWQEYQKCLSDLRQNIVLFKTLAQTQGGPITVRTSVWIEPTTQAPQPRPPRHIQLAIREGMNDTKKGNYPQGATWHIELVGIPQSNESIHWSHCVVLKRK